MNKIAITLPELIPGDARLIVRALDKGYSRIHLRKPNATEAEVAGIIEQIPLAYRKRISIHYHLDLAVRYGLGGVHLNQHSPEVPSCFEGIVSRSCHSLEEIKQYKDSCDYLFLSPIYDSISKAGYKSNFDKEILTKASQEGIIDSKVYALGGITPSKLTELESFGFGGGAMLGCVWSELMTPPIVITIAGSDCSGGAGIQADIKTISAFGCYAASVITAITSQNTLGVRDVEAVSAEIVRSQLLAVFEDLDVAAVKIGMIHDIETAQVIVEVLRQYPNIPIICDPVMVSTSGTILMKEDCRAFVEKELFPLCTLITPNLHEAALLINGIICKSNDTTSDTNCNTIDTIRSNELLSIETVAARKEINRMKEIAITLSNRYGCSVLVKGGHLEGNSMCDILYDDTIHTFESNKIVSTNLHGTGCTLSSAIASSLALNALSPSSLTSRTKELGSNIECKCKDSEEGSCSERKYKDSEEGCRSELAKAVSSAKSYIQNAIAQGASMRIGHGNGPLWHHCK